MHTPGPWKWWTSNSWRRLSCDAGGVPHIDGGVLCPVTQRPDNHPDVLVSEEDMALIAAAPDLLKHLKQALRQWAMYAEMVEQPVDDSWDLRHEETPEGALYREALAAVSKAETPVSR